MKYSVVGAGAIGGWLGARLARAGHDVTLIARGRQLAAMQAHGVRVIEPDGHPFVVRPRCSDDLSAIGSSDIVFVTVKAHAVPGLAPVLASVSAPGADLVFAQNGLPWWYFLGTPDAGRLTLESVDPGQVIAGSIPAGTVIGCVVYPAATVVEPGVIRHEEGWRLTLARPDGSRSDRIGELSKDLVGAGLKAPVTNRIREEVWLKLVGNATLNPVSALTRTTLGEMLADAELRNVVRGLMTEVAQAAASVGVALPLDVERRLQGAAELTGHKTSMLQDVEAGRPLEVEALVGSVVEVAEQKGVAVPGLRLVHTLTRALDASLRLRTPTLQSDPPPRGMRAG